MNYIAHRTDDGGREQSVIEHLNGTAALAHDFAEIFGAAELGRLCGLLHDIGKYSEAFQRRIRGSSERVDHTTAGALEAARLGNVPAAFCVAGHHGGLPDLGNKKTALPEDGCLYGKLKRKAGRDIEDYSTFQKELDPAKAEVPAAFLNDRHSAFFFTRMLFSCLVDADYLDTEEFMSGGSIARGGRPNLYAMLDLLTNHISGWWEPKNELNKKRTEILRFCIDHSGQEPGLFSLTVPTGGGKTVGSMAFALNHAVKKNLRRIIYVIPYTSIIEQTQSVFNEIFGEENIVAHYANVEYKTGEQDGAPDPRRLAAENWDTPIILTTAVQFFESLYANRPSRCRKLHNIADSVIIFDEAQMLPPPLLSPCVLAISQLVKYYGCSAVLCTATQPSLEPLFAEALPGYKVREICPQNYTTDDIFRRVSFINDGVLDDEELASKLADENQALCIVNNRKQAQRLFSKLPEAGSFHLSTTMYPAHRRLVLAKIRERLKSGAACRVISTSLIEAGVDVDFPVVYRAFAGLDSIIQAAGRCNREGKRKAKESFVHIFHSESQPPVFMLQNIAAAEYAMRKFSDPSSSEAIKAYFDHLYYILKDRQALDSQEILTDIDKGLLPFASVAQRFHLIDSSEHILYIPLGEGVDLVEELKHYGLGRGLMRKLGQYSVGLLPKQFKILLETGAAWTLTENTAVLQDLTLYSEDTGLCFEVSGGQANII